MKHRERDKLINNHISATRNLTLYRYTGSYKQPLFEPQENAAALTHIVEIIILLLKFEYVCVFVSFAIHFLHVFKNLFLADCTMENI